MLSSSTSPKPPSKSFLEDFARISIYIYLEGAVDGNHLANTKLILVILLEI